MVSNSVPLLFVAFSSQFSANEQQLMDKIRPLLVSIQVSGKEVGTGVLISLDGRYIAHKSVLKLSKDGTAEGQLPDGRKAKLRLSSQEGPTQYVLFQSDVWPENLNPAPVIIGGVEPGTNLLAFARNTAFRAQVSQEKIGVDLPTRRMVPLIEIQFESSTNPGSVGGAVLFNAKGQFTGCVAATLKTTTFNLGTPGGVGASALNMRQQQGPIGLVVGYSVSPDVTRRIIEGFQSDDRAPKIASLGVVCRDFPTGGALVQVVDTSSPAAKAGIQVGDVLVSMEGQPVRDQIAFAKILYTLKPGTTISVGVQRGGITRSLRVTTGQVNEGRSG